MEKRGIIQPGITPPENEGEKQASVESLEQNTDKRAADAAENRFSGSALPLPPRDAKPPDVQCQKPNC
jgi:hypothetical protein